MFPFQVFREFQPTLAGGFKNLGQVIRSLFANGEQGVWYDPSDLSTLFQDSAGTTPVTAVEQPVGLMLDKSKGLAMGPELVANGDFSNGKAGWTDILTTSTVSDGVITITTVSTGGRVFQTVSVEAGKSYEVTWYAESAQSPPRLDVLSNAVVVARVSGQGNLRAVFTALANTAEIRIMAQLVGDTAKFDNISVRELPGNHASQPTATSRPVLSARVNQYLATETLATQNVTTLAAQYRLSFEGMGTVTLSGTATGAYSAGSHLITCTAGTLTSTVSGSVTKADLRVANTGVGLPAYQRVNTATDYDTVGFPHYLRFDGVDDWLSTSAIDFTGTDKMTVVAGVRKLGTGDNVFVELSTTSANNGSFGLYGPLISASIPRSYGFASRGDVTATAVTAGDALPSPHSAVLRATGDIAGRAAQLRVNGVLVAQVGGGQGTGNYGNYPLYIGSRAGVSLRFSGHLYGLLIRGVLSSESQIIAGEKYINQKTRAY